MGFIKHGKAPRKGIWFKNVFVHGLTRLGTDFARCMGLDPFDVDLCRALFYLLQTAFVCADFNSSLVFSNNRLKALFNTGFKDGAGNYMYMLMSRNKRVGYQPYVFQGEFCREQDIDSREFSKIPRKQDLVVNPLDVITLADNNKIEIGTYHTLVDHIDRIGHVLAAGSYESKCKELTRCVRNSVAYARHNNKVLELNSYKGRLQVVIPFLDSQHHVCKELAVVLEYDAENQQLVVPTILESAIVKSDRNCKWSCAPHARWVELYGSAA